MNFDVLSPEEMKKEKKRLRDLYAFKTLNKEEESDFNRIIDLAVNISKKPIVCILFTYNKNSYFKPPKSLANKDAGAFLKFPRYFPRDQSVVEVQDTTKDKRCNKDAAVTAKDGIKFYTGIAIKSATGSHIGTLSIFDHKPGSLTEKQIKQLQSLTDLVLSLIAIREQKTQLELLNSGLLNALQLQLKEQNKVLNLFSRFVPPMIVKRHLKSQDENFDDAELKQVTVLFCDIRGYTKLVENLEPSEAVAILKLYYHIMSDIINSFGGMVNQYVGDEIFAIFSDPFTKAPFELQAVHCAVKMMQKMKYLNTEVGKLIKGEVKIGIGIHSGPAITGTLGSKEKIEYSVTGDTVNTGKRIESYTQSQPGTILISDKVFDKVRNDIQVIEKEPIVVKGKSKPIQVYQVVQGKNEAKNKRN